MKVRQEDGKVILRPEYVRSIIRELKMTRNGVLQKPKIVVRDSDGNEVVSHYVKFR